MRPTAICVCREGCSLCSLTHTARTSPAVHQGMTIWGLKGGGVPPHFCHLERHAKNKSYVNPFWEKSMWKERKKKGVLFFPQGLVATTLQAHMPAVRPEMMIWGVKGESPPFFFGLNLIFFVTQKGTQKFKIIGKPLLGEKYMERKKD